MGRAREGGGEWCWTWPEEERRRRSLPRYDCPGGLVRTGLGVGAEIKKRQGRRDPRKRRMSRVLGSFYSLSMAEATLARVRTSIQTGSGGSDKR
jgi:hypothetical protein